MTQRHNVLGNLSTTFVGHVYVLIATSLLLGCDKDTLTGNEGDHCQYTWQCEEGFVCNEGSCVPSDVNWEPPSDDPKSPPEDPEIPDDDPKTPPDDPPPPIDIPVLGEAHYRTCFSDLDCAVFSGNCLTQLHFSRPDVDGATSIPLHTLAPAHLQPGQGVCSDSCTNDPRICDNLYATNEAGDRASYSCQLIYLGQSPYDATTDANSLDEIAMARGIAYASMCRPPFAHADTRSDSFCAPCTSNTDCAADSACLSEGVSGGSCVEICEDDAHCPVGFLCRPHAELDVNQRYCLPIAETCGRCLDRDGDQRGIGRCGPLDAPFTDVDCDDADPNVYYDARNPQHAFPAYCGREDRNCNHLPDDEEQRGSVDHCSSCYDRCDDSRGSLENGRWTCDATAGQSAQCNVTCRLGYADCDDTPGCESFLGPQQRWYEDRDGDGYGDNATAAYFCPGSQPTSKWTQQGGDCDDNHASVYPGARELCDGLDNNCDGEIDNGMERSLSGDPELGTKCLDEKEQGVCAEGIFECHSKTGKAVDNELVCTTQIQYADVNGTAEICDCKDNNCDGAVDENIPGWGSCVVKGAIGLCSVGVLTCGDCVRKVSAQHVPLVDANGDPIFVPTEVCVPERPLDDPIYLSDRYGDGIDTNCDGFDGDAANSIFVDGRDGIDQDNNEGSMQKPVMTIQHALTLACKDVTDTTAPQCKDIIVTAGNQLGYRSNQSLKIPVFSKATSDPTPVYAADSKTWSEGTPAAVRIYGGYQVVYENCTYTKCDPTWRRVENARTTLTRVVEHNPAEMSKTYSVVENVVTTNGGAMSLALENIELKFAVSTRTVGVDTVVHGANFVGLICGGSACALLSLNNVAIDMPSTQSGSTELPEAKRARPETNREAMNGKLGCYSNVGKDSDGRNYDCFNKDDTMLGGALWGTYASVEQYTKSPFYGVNPDCGHEDPKTRGGDAALARVKDGSDYRLIDPNNPSRFLNVSDLRSWSERIDGLSILTITIDNGKPETIPSSDPKGGSDGETGQNGSYDRDEPLSYLYTNGNQHGIGARFTSQTQPTAGQNGEGGGGGWGCVGGKFKVGTSNVEIICRRDGRNSRGSGGGAGGCGAKEVGKNGGHGGSVLGVAMRAGKDANGRISRIEIHPPEARESALTITLSPPGDGGDGAGGQPGQEGGTGGTGLLWGSGKNGGRGGHSGGGAGGDAGDAIGFAIQCPTEADCVVDMPAHLQMAPRAYIHNLPDTPARGGRGGEVPKASGTTNAPSGRNGIAAPIYYFTNPPKPR